MPRCTRACARARAQHACVRTRTRAHVRLRAAHRMQLRVRMHARAIARAIARHVPPAAWHSSCNDKEGSPIQRGAHPAVSKCFPMHFPMQRGTRPATLKGAVMSMALTRRCPNVLPFSAVLVLQWRSRAAWRTLCGIQMSGKGIVT